VRQATARLDFTCRVGGVGLSGRKSWRLSMTRPNQANLPARRPRRGYNLCGCSSMHRLMLYMNPSGCSRDTEGLNQLNLAFVR
jgi:hypothetical protein